MKILLLISFNFLQHIRQCFFPIVAFVHAVRAKGCLLYNIFLAKKNIQFELKKIENNLLLTLFQETPLSDKSQIILQYYHMIRNDIQFFSNF